MPLMLAPLLAAALAAQTTTAPGARAVGTKAPAQAAARPIATQGQRAGSRVHNYGALVIAPAGDRIASVEQRAGGNGAEIVVRAVAGGGVLRTIALDAAVRALAFGPAGQLAWIAAGGEDGTATVVVDDGKAHHTVATVKGLVQSLRFSPTGDRIAALVVLNPSKETGATQAGARQIGEIGETSDEQRLAIFATTGPAVTADGVVPVSPADRYIYEYDWTPDGRGFVVTSALGNGDNNWWVATLDHVDAATGAVRPIAKPATQINFPRVSPDGRSVAFIGGLMSDFGSVGGDVWTVPVAGGTPSDITHGAPMTFTTLAWTKAGLRAVALHNDRMELVALTPDKAPMAGYSQPVSLSASGFDRASFAQDGDAVATVSQDFTHAPALLAGPGLNPVQIAHDNDALAPVVAARSVTWKNQGYTVQGWLVSPLNLAPGAKAPMIVSVHGGPSAASTPRFYETGPSTEFTDAGYHLFMPNPRGSYGQGEAFTAANRRDFGGGDLRDILAGVDAVEKVAPVDDNRLGLTGCSYGGFMAMWANTQTNRFKAIVAGAGLSNMVSYYGTNGIDQWLIPFYGTSVYNDYKIYEDASAVYHVKTAKTPTFIYVGERDIEVPPTQSIEWWHALKAEGVDTSLVIYPDAGHCVPRPDQNADVRKRALAWFGKYLGK